MLKTLIFRLSLGIVLASSSLAFSQTNDAVIYEFKGDIPPIKLTFSDLEKFLRDLQHLYSNAPESAGSENNCTYELAGPKGSISGPSIDKIFGEDRLLTYANEFRLNCFNRHIRVSSINITLGKYPRWEIKGTDRVLLEAVRSLLENFGQTYHTYLGGLLPQIIAFFSLWSLAFTALLLREARKKLDSEIRLLISMVTSFFAPLLLFGSGIPESIFPTVAVYKGTASFLERYSADISFWGLIISLGLAIILWRRPVAIVAPKVEAPPSPQKVQDLSSKA